MENKKYIESIGQAYQQVQEKLKGGQKKLDKDGDGDIDGTDFAMMRKKKKMDENHMECPKCKGEGCDHCDGKGYHKKTDEQGSCSSGRKTRKEDEEIVMNPKKKKEKGEKATNQDSNMAQESTNEAKDHVSSNHAMHSHSNEAEKKAHAAHMKKKHGVKTTYHGDDEVRYHGSKKNVKKALGNHYGGDHDHAKEEHPHIYKEDTKWPIYQRIMEKNVVNQNAVPPQPMIPAEKQLKDHEGETVNQSQDHISAAAAQWIKDHEGNQVPDDAVDHEKVVAKNKADQMRTVPNQAKDEVNKKAAKAETMKKVEDK